jgi:hypothetical protein
VTLPSPTPLTHKANEPVSGSFGEPNGFSSISPSTADPFLYLLEWPVAPTGFSREKHTEALTLSEVGLVSE